MDQPGDPLHSKSIGTFHSDDIEYVFGNLDSRKGAAWRPEDYELSKEMQTYWTNFAKTGDPNSAGLPVWPRYGAPSNWLVMHLGDIPRAEPDSHRDRFLFLNSVWKN
jgi:para-nitrobenzyl esterase